MIIGCISSDIYDLKVLLIKQIIDYIVVSFCLPYSCIVHWMTSTVLISIFNFTFLNLSQFIDLSKIKLLAWN